MTSTIGLLRLGKEHRTKRKALIETQCKRLMQASHIDLLMLKLGKDKCDSLRRERLNLGWKAPPGYAAPAWLSQKQEVFETFWSQR